jgi:hypothetical protein
MKGAPLVTVRAVLPSSTGEGFRVVLFSCGHSLVLEKMVAPRWPVGARRACNGCASKVAPAKRKAKERGA